MWLIQVQIICLQRFIASAISVLIIKANGITIFKWVDFSFFIKSTACSSKLSTSNLPIFRLKIYKDCIFHFVCFPFYLLVFSKEKKKNFQIIQTITQVISHWNWSNCDIILKELCVSTKEVFQGKLSMESHNYYSHVLKSMWL